MKKQIETLFKNFEKGKYRGLFNQLKIDVLKEVGKLDTLYKRAITERNIAEKSEAVIRKANDEFFAAHLNYKKTIEKLRKKLKDK